MKILVAYEGGSAANRRIAERIALRLRRPAVKSQVVPMEAVENVADYDAVVVGSSMSAGTWSAGACSFMARNRDALSRVPTWLFSSGSPNAPESPPGDELAEFREAIEPVVQWLQAGPDYVGRLGLCEPQADRLEILSGAVA